ncbi:MAG TPA: hypothetical protein VKB51_06055 [bacterium]|nr:hypothetical protein [bacterium]
MSKVDGAALPLEDWMVWVAVRDARLSPAGFEAIRSLLAEKETQLREPAPGTPLVSLTADSE